MPRSNASNDDDTAALLDALEHEESNPVYNSQRIAQIKAELSSTKTSQSNPIADTTPSSAGTVTTLLNNSPLPTLPTDQAVLDFTTQLSHCILHFSHPDFARCATMDKHLTCLSTAHSSSSGARFARVDVRNVPFIVEKLKIRVLPCVIGFVKKGILSGVKIGRKGRDDDGQSDGTESGLWMTAPSLRILLPNTSSLPRGNHSFLRNPTTFNMTNSAALQQRAREGPGQGHPGLRYDSVNRIG
ncbi:GTPase inhibitor [Coccidioides immitis RMSCC 3703]|uniref:GTPase inhibitor n=1 Tax=Coccidioides immitis RMSCC 3703 TaxID=454286 RepID=A0A0J8QRK5_COCIT|nr:GTPase inhibitor [Coccidioides immitis RMSCC 3703]